MVFVNTEDAVQKALEVVVLGNGEFRPGGVPTTFSAFFISVAKGHPLEWLKHDTNFWSDPKIKRLRAFDEMGPTVYLFIRDSVGAGIDHKHTACTTPLISQDLIAEFPGLGKERLNAILNYLMEPSADGQEPLLDRDPKTRMIRCLKILTRLNPNQMRNLGMKTMIEEANRFQGSAGPTQGVSTPTEGATNRLERLDEIKREKERLEGVLGRALREDEEAHLKLSIVKKKNSA